MKTIPWLRRPLAILAGALLLAAACPLLAAPPDLPWHLIARYPHSTSAFTEGLAICDGDLVESMGLYGESRIQIRTLHTNRVLETRSLPASIFAEGVSCAADRIVQLTWHAGIIFTYDHHLDPLGEYRYPYDGWGLAWDGHQLIASDGTDTLHLLDPETLAVVGAVKVHDGDRPVTQINELEWARGALWANIWHSDRIARIDLRTGQVTGWLDMAKLVAQAKADPAWQPSSENVLNGIAWDPDSGHFFVTGKRWPLMFEIALGPAASTAGDAQR
ncbi:MAG TPA: glutaminyl-peptide cyclotransferase [Nevskiaceae bacterium]